MQSRRISAEQGGLQFLEETRQFYLKQLILSNSKVGFLISGYGFSMGEAKAGKCKNPTKLVEPVLEK